MSLGAKAGISTGILLAGLVAGVYLDRSLLADSPLPLLGSDVTEQGSHYQFINPLLFCQDQNISSLSNSTGNQVQHMLENYIQSEKDAGTIADAAVYFRDLGDGPWALVNGELRSTPASLLKIPIAMGTYRRIEKDPSFASIKIKFDGDTDANASQYFKPRDKMVPGKMYTIEDLLRAMLENSDNNALLMIGKVMDPKDAASTYSDLGIETPSTPSGYTISVRTFASFFRVLYNAS